MAKLCFVSAALLPSLSLLLAFPRTAPADTPPNILLVVADDMGVDMVKAYGEHPDPAHTPTIDSLATGGLLFRNAWSNPFCCPGRSALLTGRHCRSTGFGFGTNYYNTPTELPSGEVFLPEVLPPAYSSAAIGKWHLGSKVVSGQLHPNINGFQHFAGSMTIITGMPMDDYFSFPKVIDGVLTQANVYATTDQVNDALGFIQATTQPWFVYLAFHAPHAPFHKPPANLHTYNLPSSINGNFPIHTRAAAEAMDTELNRLLTNISPTVLANTYIIFVGDNGTDKPATTAPFLPGHAKGTVYEGGLNVPLIIKGPGVAAGAECGALANLTDIFATIADVVGVSHASATDSISLRPYFAQPGLPSLRTTVYAENFVPNGSGPYTFRQRAIRNDRYKLMYIYDHSNLPTEQHMFDLSIDPFELNDLLAAPLTSQAQIAFDALSPLLDEIIPPWQSVATGLAGSHGVPQLTGTGNLQAGSPVTLALTQARPASLAALLLGYNNVGNPIAGGILVPMPVSWIIQTTSGQGDLQLTGAWPAGTMPGKSLLFQYWIADATAPEGWSASNGVAANFQ